MKRVAKAAGGLALVRKKKAERAVMHLTLLRKLGKRVVWTARCDSRFQYDVVEHRDGIAMLFNDSNFWFPEQPSAAGLESVHRCRECAADYIKELP